MSFSGRAPATLSLLTLLIIGGCQNTPHAEMTVSQARTRILAHLPTGWRAVQTARDREPFEQHADGSPSNSLGGEFIALEGPQPVRVSGYYCAGRWCEDINAHEALELWIMPETYRDGTNTLALMAERAPERLYHDGHVQVYALASRRLSSSDDFDAAVTDASREQSAMAPRGDHDLPLSWSAWRDDIKAMLTAKSSPSTP